MAVVKIKYDGSNLQSRGRKLLLEDPNPTYNRIFIDHQGFDMATLTPQWNKQFNYAGTNGVQSSFGNAGVTYQSWNIFPGGNQGTNGFATRSAAGFSLIYGASQTAFVTNDIYPLDDYEYHRLGEIVTQKGMISTFAFGDSIAVIGASSTWDTRVPHSIRDILGTYWRTLDFVNAPVYKNLKSQVTGNSYMCHYLGGSLFIGGWNGSGTTSAVNQRVQADSWMGHYFFMYGPDITTQLTQYSTKYTSGAFYVTGSGGYNSSPSGFTHLCYEDPLTGALFGLYVTNMTTYLNRLTIGTNASPGLSTGLLNAGDQDNGYGDMYYMGLDIGNRMYFLRHQIQTAGEPYTIYRYDGRQSLSTTILSNSLTGNTGVGRRLEPSNIRRDANNRYVFYSSHLNTSATNGWAPIRYVWDPTVNTDAAIASIIATPCNVAYPGSNTYSSYATPMTLAWTSYSAGSANTYNHPWRTKPWQFVSNGNVYISFWMVDQYASWLGVATLTAQTSRWNTTQQRTMITYQIGSGTPGSTPTGNADANLTFHSAYTFPNVIDIPKNFMPLNANGTLMAVVSGSKTNFFVWNNTSGWNAGGAYNTEFRMLGLDSTGRLWGSACDVGNGSLHIVTPSLSMNVTLSLATTNYTYTGTPISSSATVNVYDSYNNRVQTTVTLTMDGTSSVFTNNGLRTITVTTNPSGDTTVPITINGAGVNNIYVAINNA